MNCSTLPLPAHFEPSSVGQIRRVPYQKLADEAKKWSAEHHIQPSHHDRYKTCLLLVDVQNTFCIPEFELFVAGVSGTAAVEDNRRLCEFIYRNLNTISTISPTMDTHQAVQVFHSIFLVDQNGQHPPPFTMISTEDIESQKWRFNPDLGAQLDIDAPAGQAHLRHYAKQLYESGKYDLTIWPYHAMLGGIGHALVAAVEEAIFFHTLCRVSQPDFQVKGDNPLTEHYSVLRPEILNGLDGRTIAEANTGLVDKLLSFDALIVAGQAKSHCVAWTVADLLDDIKKVDENLARKIYLLEDCTSPVVIPGVIDYSAQADQAFGRFAEAGMHIVRSTDPVDAWPGFGQPISG